MFKLLIMFLLICLLWMLCVISVNFFIDWHKADNVIVQPPEDGAEMQKLKKLMKKHGVNVMYQGWDGRHWFKRDGKKVYIKYEEEL